MAGKKPRGVFWVVSTHALTTGFAMPAVAAIIGFLVIAGMEPGELGAFLILFFFLALGYIGGAYYSLYYIRNVAAIEDPRACVTPSIVTFAVVSVIQFAFGAWQVLLRPEPGAISPVLSIAALAVFYVLTSVAFALITKRGFASMAPPAKTDIAVQE